MIMGFSFNGVHTSSLGVGMRSINRQILPSTQDKYLEIPGRDGSYLFPGANNDRAIEVELNITTNNLTQRQQVARQVAAWLRTKTRAELIFDDEPDVKYMAKLANQLDLEPLAFAGKTKVMFRCLPFALYQVSTGEDVILDSYLPLDSWVTLNPGEDFTISITGDTTFDIDYMGTQEVGLGSHDGSKFDIIIIGSFTTLSLGLNGKTINYTASLAGQTLTIDNVNATVKIGVENKLAYCTGDIGEFLKMIPGNNTAIISGTGLNCTVLFNFRPQYL
jgi:predicted phage tail component-like protein